MASKLGRLRQIGWQWAGEVISSKEKTSQDDEFIELERDIERRKSGINRLITVSEAYQHSLSKKKISDALTDGEKLLPVDTFGIVMILHGEEFGEDSTFGDALVKLGRAHCKVATLQEAYALTFKDTFLTSLERFRDEIKEYETLRKKLETRRSTSDTATAKFEKLQNSKKEKDRREAEDEMERAKFKYEETAEDLRAHMHAIQENEHAQLHELTTFIDLETNYVQNYLEVLRDVKAEWQEKASVKRNKASPRRGSVNAQTFSPPSRRATPRINGSNGRYRVDSTTTLDSSDDEPALGPNQLKHTRTNSNGSKPPSRPSSRLSRKRANSAAVSLRGSDEKLKDKGKDKEKGTDKDKDKPRRMSVAGWASNAVDSVTGSKSKKSKDKESFATLDDELGAQRVGETGSLSKGSSFRGLSRRTSSKSKENLPMASSIDTGSMTLSKILKPPSLQDRKVVRALYDFSGSSDELSFRAGNEIVVVNEVLDDWWLGEVDGRTGLFPTSYTEPVDNKQLAVPAVKGNAVDSDNYLTSDADDDRELGAAPMSANKTPTFFGSFHDHNNDSESFTDVTEDEREPIVTVPGLATPQKTWADHDDDWFTEKPQAQVQNKPAAQPHSTTPKQRSVLGSLKLLDPAQQPLINRSISEPLPPSPTLTQKSSPPKVPPPPPPRRIPSSKPAQTPPIPMRKLPGSVAASISAGGTSGSSSSASMLSSSTSSLSGRPRADSSTGQTYDRSPFESAVELELQGTKCDSFRQNPFKPTGMCSNCREFHN